MDFEQKCPVLFFCQNSFHLDVFPYERELYEKLLRIFLRQEKLSIETIILHPWTGSSFIFLELFTTLNEI